MGKIRHIAYRAEDVEAMAKFFAEGLGMTILQRRGNNAIDLSDGTLNITILPATLPTSDGRGYHTGIEHIGFTFEDEAEAGRTIVAAGGTESNAIKMDSAHYEQKYVGPEGIVVDVGHWIGTGPIEEAVTASV
jgi:catechol 2,3-dioxygenase-like lactoylglutathione lyase family enzyme